MRILIGAFLALAALSGCSTVKPYQRELLAQPSMQVDAPLDRVVEQHMLESREASAGGFGGAGGGCGCN